MLMAARETPNLEVRVQILYHLPQGSRLAGEIATLIRWRSLVQIQPALPMEQWVSGLNQLIANQPYSNRVPKVQILPAPPMLTVAQLVELQIVVLVVVSSILICQPNRGVVQSGRTRALGA